MNELNVSLPSHAVPRVHFAHDLRNENQIDDHPNADHEQASIADPGRAWMLVEAEWHADESRDEHRPRGPEPSEVEPMSAHGTEEDCEHVGRALRLCPDVLHEHDMRRSGGRRLISVQRSPRCAVPPLTLAIRVEMPARFRRCGGRSHDSTVPGTFSPRERERNRKEGVLIRMQAWHDEGKRFERTGRLDQGPCWCPESVAADLAAVKRGDKT